MPHQLDDLNQDRPVATRPARKRRRRVAAIGVLSIVAVVILAATLHHRSVAASLLRADPDRILADPALRQAALAAGKPVYRKRCAGCHGDDGLGNQQHGIPDLTDDDHLYGTGKVSEIEQIIRYGIRAQDKRGWTLASMPAYASPVPYPSEPLPSQSPAQIEALTQLLLGFTGRATDQAAAKLGQAQFNAAGCWDCHGRAGEGDSAVGAPALTDATWLYGGDHDAIYRSIARGRAGYSPAFARLLTPAEIRDAAVYTAALAQAPIPSRKTR